jgi:hypothetical protein
MTTAAARAASIAIMPPSIAPLPQHHPGLDTDVGSTQRFIAWTMLLGLAFWPRLWILGFWIFGRQLGDAFSSWMIPAVGFFILPWTTLMYAFMWGIDSNAVSGWEWIVVGTSFVVDLLWWAWGRSSFE